MLRRVLQTNGLLTFLAAALVYAACGGAPKASAPHQIPLEVQAFDEFPIVWLGESYDVNGDGVPEEVRSGSLNVSPESRHPRTNDILKPEFRWFQMSYGYCEPLPCAIPTFVAIYEPCSWYVTRPFEGVQTTTIRGATAVVWGDVVRIETADFVALIGAPGKDDGEAAKNALRFAEDLVGANEKASGITADSDFRPKTEPCPPSNLPPTPIRPGGQLSIDLDLAKADLQNERTVGVGESAEVAVYLHNVDSDYWGYLWELEWDDATLDFGGAVENTVVHEIGICTPSAETTDPAVGVPPGKEWAGQGGGCIAFTNARGYFGTLVTITVKCAAPGTTDIRLVTPAEDLNFGATLVNEAGASVLTSYGDAAKITCE